MKTDPVPRSSVLIDMLDELLLSMAWVDGFVLLFLLRSATGFDTTADLTLIMAATALSAITWRAHLPRRRSLQRLMTLSSALVQPQISRSALYDRMHVAADTARALLPPGKAVMLSARIKSSTSIDPPCFQKPRPFLHVTTHDAGHTTGDPADPDLTRYLEQIVLPEGPGALAWIRGSSCHLEPIDYRSNDRAPEVSAHERLRAQALYNRWLEAREAGILRFSTAP